MATEPCRLSASEALEALQSDELTVESYAQSLCDHIEKRDDVVKAWAHFDRTQVLRSARALDSVPKAERGPLHGVAVGIKDVILTKGKNGNGKDMF